MKERIRQILREETSGFDPKMLNTAYKMMDHLTKDCLWYYDTPEQRFEYSSESIWLINPETKEWVLELEKSGKLWYYNEIYLTFKRYFNMEESDFKLFIKLWVEDALKRGVSTTSFRRRFGIGWVEDALKRGVSTTNIQSFRRRKKVEDALKRGVSTTAGSWTYAVTQVEDALKRGVSTTLTNKYAEDLPVEDALKRGKELR